MSKKKSIQRENQTVERKSGYNKLYEYSIYIKLISLHVKKAYSCLRAFAQIHFFPDSNILILPRM